VQHPPLKATSKCTAGCILHQGPATTWVTSCCANLPRTILPHTILPHTLIQPHQLHSTQFTCSFQCHFWSATRLSHSATKLSTGHHSLHQQLQQHARSRCTARSAVRLVSETSCCRCLRSHCLLDWALAVLDAGDGCRRKAGTAGAGTSTVKTHIERHQLLQVTQSRTSATQGARLVCIQCNSCVVSTPMQQAGSCASHAATLAT
jgi:hypothetical protein